MVVVIEQKDEISFPKQIEGNADDWKKRGSELIGADAIQISPARPEQDGRFCQVLLPAQRKMILHISYRIILA